MSLLGNIPEKNLPEYGLSTKSDLKTLKFTLVFAEYVTKNGAFTQTQNYRVMVLNKDNKPCGLLTIFNSNNKLSAADFGALELSKELTAQKQAIKSGSFGIYRDHEKQCDYLFDRSIPNKNAAYYKLFSKNVLKYNEVTNAQN